MWLSAAASVGGARLAESAGSSGSEKPILVPEGRGYNLAVVPAAHDSLLKALTAEPKVRLAVLFGSEALGKADAASDLDVGVAGPDASELPALALRLERASGRPVDLVALTTAPPLLRFEIARDGRVLVQRAPHLWSDFKSRAMVDWWDWAPIARRFHAAAAARLRQQVTDGPA